MNYTIFIRKNQKYVNVKEKQPHNVAVNPL